MQLSKILFWENKQPTKYTHKPNWNCLKIQNIRYRRADQLNYSFDSQMAMTGLNGQFELFNVGLGLTQHHTMASYFRFSAINGYFLG